MDAIRFFDARAPQERPPSAWLPLLKLCAGFLFLNALLCLEMPSGEMQWDSLLRVSSDGLCLLAGMSLLVRPGHRLQPAACAAVTLVVILLGLFQWADRLVPMIFNRAFNLFMDSQRLPDLVILLWRTRPPEAVLLGMFAAGAGIAALGWSVWRALQALYDGLSNWTAALRRPRLALAVLSGTIWAAAAGAPAGFIKESVFPRLGEELRFILNLSEIRNRHQALFGEAMARADQARGDLLNLDRASVFLIVVESYGMTAFNDPRHAAHVLPAVRTTEASLRSIGLDMCSAYVTAPTFGGGSWLSHATLASGVRIDSQIAHDLLLASALAPLADYFNRAGYRTVRAMPGTQWPWPEGAFYRYEQTLIASDFDYRGPTFGFAPMPDQFVLDWVARRIIRDTARPLFVEVILTGSHAAFDIQAPYLDDWNLIGDGSVFHTVPPVRFPFGWTRLPEASPAYSAAMAHMIILLKDFIRRHIAPSALIIIVGDHQPCGELVGPEQPWSVPVHVISGNPESIRKFARRGYTPGLVPMQPLPHPGMETLFWDLIEGFSRGHPDGRHGH
jgi:hypothetical protein